jgi:predicted transcriptional regulator
MGSAIEYDGYRIDETSQILLRLLRDMGRQATAGELRAEAGLDETRPVHYRYEEYLGPAGLVLRADTEERPGDAQDEIVYGLSDEGVEFVVANENELTDAVAAAEAVDTLRRIRATVDGFEERVSDVEEDVDGMDRWKNRWSTRVGRVERSVEDLEEDAVDEDRLSRFNSLIKDRSRRRLDRIEKLEERVDALEEEVAKRPTQEQVRDMIQDSREQPRQWDVWLAEDVADVRQDAQGLFGG